MASLSRDCARAADAGLQTLLALVRQLQPAPLAAGATAAAKTDLLLTEVGRTGAVADAGTRGGWGSGPATSDGGGTHTDQATVTSLVERARSGDAEAFGELYDRYVLGVYRFCYHRTSSVALAEDLTSETFFRALRAVESFRWQGRDFGAWLTTIARNLVADHYKSSRARLETASDMLPEQRERSPGPEDAMITQLTREALATALAGLPGEQRDCLVMRFLQGLSIAETARVLDRSEGAVKQLQLRAVRSLARDLPPDLL
ncbi:sigma-70 family RNA polymerase sigma factor [soil metagenome]